MADQPKANDATLVELATELTIAWIANPNTRASAAEVPSFLQTMHAAVSRLATASAPEANDTPEPEEHIPAVSVRKSLASRDHILSMIDGRPYKTLKRHLSTHGLTPAQYRDRYNLKADYPMVAEGYGALRREIAKNLGLGRRPEKNGKSAAAGGAAARTKPAKSAAAPQSPDREKPKGPATSDAPRGADQPEVPTAANRDGQA